MFRERLLVVCFALIAAHPIAAFAQEAQEEDEQTIRTEEPDATRLDVERLPPEAIQITRSLYAHGFFLEARIGALGMINGIGDYMNVGPWASVGFGLEIFDFLHVIVAGEVSLHNTNAPSPPAPTAFEIVAGTAAVRLQANFTEAFALWASGLFSVLVATTDLLELYGFQNANTIGISYGGEIGADAHFKNRHHSIGLLAGVRHFPTLEAMGGSSPAIGIHGSAYLRYVF